METTGSYLTVIYSHATVSHKGQKPQKKKKQFSHGHSCCPLMAVWEVTLHRVKVPASVCSHCCCLVASLNNSPFIPQDDFLLIHYDKGPCRNKLGHSRASVIWHRTQVRNRPSPPPSSSSSPLHQHEDAHVHAASATRPLSDPLARIIWVAQWGSTCLVSLAVFVPRQLATKGTFYVTQTSSRTQRCHFPGELLRIFAQRIR